MPAGIPIKIHFFFNYLHKNKLVLYDQIDREIQAFDVVN